MIEDLIQIAKRPLGYGSDGRNIDVFDDDTFLVSFPESGGIWTRFLLANLLYPQEPVSFRNIDRLIPELEFAKRRMLKRMSRPRLLSSHEYFDPRYRKVIYLVRDARDVARSQFRHQRALGRIGEKHLAGNHAIEQLVTSFIAGDGSDYGSWGDHVSSWLVPRQNANEFLLLRYEDMEAQTGLELARVAEFLGMKASQDSITQAVERSSAVLLSELECDERSASADDSSGHDLAVGRPGAAGSWREGLPETCIADLETAWGPLMKWLGYELALAKDHEARARVEPVSPGAPAR